MGAQGRWDGRDRLLSVRNRGKGGAKLLWKNQEPQLALYLQWVKREEKKAIPSIYKIGLQFCRMLLGPGGNFENTFILSHPYQSHLLCLPLPRLTSLLRD